MRIVFNFIGVGMGNNGGTRTIIRCGETLAAMGHEVIMATSDRCKYTWHTPVNVYIKQNLKRAPECDAVIATGWKSVTPTLQTPCPRKFYYIRGLEIWGTRLETLLDGFRKLTCIVNSTWLFHFLKQHRIKSTVVYPGIDFNWFFDEGGDREGFGGLYHPSHRTKRHDIVEAVGKELGVRPFLVNRDLKKAKPYQMREAYNKLKVWLAPTELEGLHNPPMEAAMCGAAIVCSDAPRNGMSDYVIPDKNALVFEKGDTEGATEKVRELLEDEQKRTRLVKMMKEKLTGSIGTRRHNMERLLKVISR